MISKGFAELHQLRDFFAQIAEGGHLREVSQAMADAAVKEIDHGFAAGVDPYDRPWEPLAYRSGDPLVDEGNLRAALTRPPIVTERGFVVTTRGAAGDSVAFAGTHQYGKTIRARTAAGMRFRVGGTSRRNGPRWVSVQEVTIPKRQFMPEGTLGPRWSLALEVAARQKMAEIARGA